MGKEAYVLCIGPFEEELVDMFEYPEKYYTDTEKGTLVVAELFCCNTDNQSIELANAFGFEPWDFARHHINTRDHINWGALYELEERCAEWDIRDIDRLKVFLDKAWFILYRPELYRPEE